MDLEEFCKESKNMLDDIVDYFESISERHVKTNVHPGYLKALLPETAPKDAESFEKIMEDVEKHIIPGLSHWRHPGFHAYFPTVSSYSSIIGSMLSEIFGCASFNFNICPSTKGLEEIVLNWFGKMIGLPECFLNRTEGSKGGGLLQGTVSECFFMCMTTARQKFIKKVSTTRLSQSKPMVLTSLVAYCSAETHSSIKKCAVLSLVTLRILETDKDLRLRGETLLKAVRDDKEIGLIPFFVNISFGGWTGACDSVEEIGPICQEYGIWLNVDASYAGNALICPEYQHLFKGIDYASSITINFAKWLMVHLDCSVVYAKNREKLSEYLIVDRTLFGYGSSNEDWTYPGNKGYSIFKLYVTVRTYGIEGLQRHVRNHVRLAKEFAKYVGEEERFEVLTCEFGIVCFRLKGPDEDNKILLRAINHTCKLLLNSYIIKGKFALRFVVCREEANEEDIINAWTIIQEITNKLSETHDDEESTDWADCYDYTLP